jgi:hypothetical protein
MRRKAKTTNETEKCTLPLVAARQIKKIGSGGHGVSSYSCWGMRGTVEESECLYYIAIYSK